MRLTFIFLVAATISVSAAEQKFTQFPKRLGAYFEVAFRPNYPEAAMAWHKYGEGWFELSIDSDTGKIQQVKVLKSTGVKILDDSAAAAFLQWKAKPHMINHATVPVQFAMRTPIGSHLAP